METPSEWAKRFNREKSDLETGAPSPEAQTVDNPAPVAEFPSEPFQCPACGQLLAPACRVCVACRKPIDFGAIARPQEVVLPATPAPSTEPRPELVRYPWRIFFAVLGIAILVGFVFLALISFGILKLEQAQLAMNGVPTLVGVWVFFDAHRRRIPRPLRWAVGTMMLLAIIFPWYLARRRKPKSAVPFVEAEVGPITRFVLFALLLLILVSLIINITQGPAPNTAPTPAPKFQKSGDSSQPRITTLRPRSEGGRPRWPGEESRPLTHARSAQAETSAPSEARQT